MSKNGLYLVVALAIAITAATFFISRPSSSTTCSGVEMGTENAIGPTSTVKSQPTKAAVRGFPLWYYQEPFPAGCVSANGSGSIGAFRVGSLGDDFLIWLLVSILLFLANAGIKALRGPNMLGDKMGDGHA